MTFNDIFKSSFLEDVSAFQPLDMIIALALSLVLGLFIFMVYKRTFNGVMYSQVFGLSLIAMCMICLLYTSAIVLSGNNAALGMTTGDLTALFSYATQILMSLMMLSMVFAMIIISVASARRIAEILDEKTDIANPDNPEMTVRDGSINFENVDFAYASKANTKVLDNINLSIASGETVGIIGGTGSSKSSLVQLIPRLYDVTGGRLTLGGIDVKKI